jgi:hypothetical protein
MIGAASKRRSSALRRFTADGGVTMLKTPLAVCSEQTSSVQCISAPTSAEHLVALEEALQGNGRAWLDLVDSTCSRWPSAD